MPRRRKGRRKYDSVEAFRLRTQRTSAALQPEFQFETLQNPWDLRAERTVAIVSRFAAVHCGQLSHALVHGAGLRVAVCGPVPLCRCGKLPQTGGPAVFYRRLAVACQGLGLNCRGKRRPREQRKADCRRDEPQRSGPSIVLRLHRTWTIADRPRWARDESPVPYRLRQVRANSAPIEYPRPRDRASSCNSAALLLVQCDTHEHVD